MLNQLLTQWLPRLLEGFMTTIFLLVLSAVGGLCLGFPLAIAGLSQQPLLRSLSRTFRFVFRGIPGLVLLYFVYYGIAQLEIVRSSPLWIIFKEAYWCAWLTLSVNDAAFTSELLYGAFKAVPQDYLDGAIALGMKPFPTFFLVRLPLALRLVLPAYTTELVYLTKATSIVSTITILDLMGTADIIYKETFDPFAPLFTAGLLYLFLIFIITRLSNLIENRFFRYPQV